MELVCTEDNRLFIMVYFIKHHPHSLCFTRFNFYSLIKLWFFVYLPLFSFSFNNLVVRDIYVIIEGRLNALHLKWSKESIIHTLFKRICVNWLAKIFICINIIFSLWCSCKTKLYCRRKIF